WLFYLALRIIHISQEVIPIDKVIIHSLGITFVQK
ncbi:hypothetical protein NT04LM_3839, partial [Listeria monocytogenes FSL F2-208]